MAFYSTNRDGIYYYVLLILIITSENTVPTKYVNSCTGKIENSLLFYLSDRKIVFKNTL